MRSAFKVAKPIVSTAISAQALRELVSFPDFREILAGWINDAQQARLILYEAGFHQNSLSDQVSATLCSLRKETYSDRTRVRT